MPKWFEYLIGFGLILFLCLGGWWLGIKTVTSKLANNTNQATPSPVNPTGQITATAPLITDSNPPINPDQFKTELYRFINTWRQENKLSPLKTDIRLEQSAQEKISIMQAAGKFDHVDNYNNPNWEIIQKAGYNYALAGENLAFNAASAWQTLTGWRESASHSAQLLNAKYQDMGLALDCTNSASASETNQPRCIVVLHLAKPK